MLGTSPQKCTMRSHRQALPLAPRHTHSTCRTTGRHRHRKATGGLYPVPALRHSDTAMAEPTSPRKTRLPSPALDVAHGVIGALRLQSRGGDPPSEDAGTDSDLELIPVAPAGSATAGPAPLAGSVQALLPAWKRGYCIGESWCPRQHPRPTANNGALPAVGYAAASAALRYCVAQGWIQDETTRGSMNIQEAVDRVAHTGQTEVAPHTRGRYGRPAGEIIVQPTGMKLVLAVDMTQGVLHATRVQRVRPQWTIQVYTPPQAWPFSTWAVLAIMWHLAPEWTPTETAQDIAWDPHAWPATQDFPLAQTPKRSPSGARGGGVQPRGDPPATPRQEGALLPADRYGPGRPARLRTRVGRRGGTTAAGPLHHPLWYLPMDALAHATQSVKGAFPPPEPPGAALLRSLQAGAAWTGWRENGRPGPNFPLTQGQALLHAEDMGTVESGAMLPDTACRWITAAAPQPLRLPPACHRLLRTVPPLAPRHALTQEVWRALLSHPREWMATSSARYPPEPVLEGLTAPTPGVRHVLHRASAPTEQLTDEELDMAPEPLRVLNLQGHIPPTGASSQLACLGLQHRVEATHAGGVVGQWLPFRNRFTAQGHWYLHQLLSLPRAGPEHRRQNP